MITQKRAGYATISGPEGIKEFDTCTCKHCNKVWVVKSTEKGQGDLGGWCRMCMAPICPECADKGCYPFMKRLLKYEQRQKMLNNVGV
jgi:hypothetical protein